MHQFHRKIRRLVVNLYFWGLDYLYVSCRQILGFIGTYDAKRYLNSTSHKPAVILLPGVYERWHFMKPVADLLYTHGYSVHIVESLGYNTGSIEAMAARVEDYARRNHIKNYHVVAHSKGGLVAKYLLLNKAHTIRSVVTINTPFGGSKYAGLIPLHSIRPFLPSSEILTLLAADKLSNNKITSIYGIFDPHIPDGSYLEGATNIQLHTRGHFLPVSDSNVHAEIINSLKKF